MSRNIKPTFILMALEKELKEHDWTFNMSDDHGYWKAGVAQQKRIRTMVEDAYLEQLDPADMFYEYYPLEGCDVPEYYGIRRTWEEQLDKKSMETNKKETVQ